MTALRGGRADRTPLTIYKWILSHAQDPRRLLQLGWIPIDSRAICTEARPGIRYDVREIEEDGLRKTLCRIITPVGEVDEKLAYDPVLGSAWRQEFFVKSVDDYPVLEFLFEHRTFEPNYEPWTEADAETGSDGIVLGEIAPVPLAQLWTAWMGVEAWSEGMLLHADRFERLHEAVCGGYRRQIELAAAGPAEIIWMGDNVTGTIISPAAWEKYCKPVYEHACAVLHAGGKRAFAHYDGANRPLARCIAESDLDIIEAFTPPPMEEMTVAEARAAWPGKVLSLNFPGNVFAQPDETIERWTLEYLEQAGDKAGFAIGCTEEFDFSHFDRAFEAIARAVGEGEGR